MYSLKLYIFTGLVLLNSYNASKRSEKLLKHAQNHRVRTTSGVNSLEPMFTHCCSLGMTWAEEKRQCEVTVSPHISGVPVDLQTPCLVTASICCLRASRNAMCDLGKVDAMDGNECLISVLPGGEYRKDCCDSCKIGLMTGSRGESCSFSNFGFEYPWDEGFADCCQISKLSSGGLNLPDVDDGNNEVQDGRCGTNNVCEQICKDTGVAVECSCNTGYQLGEDSKSCIDIDECNSGFHLCDSDLQRCINTEGSYFCLNEDGSRDFPRTRPQYSALEAGRTTFSPANVPRPVQPGSEGLCPIGYAYNSQSRICEDIDECALYIHSCNRNTHNCHNTIGSYLCVEHVSPECGPGYKFNPSKASCFDINECAEGLDYCNREREFCLNTNGGYECQPKTRTQCPAGYKYNALLLSCEDVNECHENLHNCDVLKEHCRNTIGGYECDLRCEKGFGYNVNLRTCLDINECEEKIHDCKTGQNCINVPGSYQCISEQCPAGYKPSPEGGCQDVDECVENLDSCDRATDVCINEIGHYKCESKPTEQPQCARGYRYDSLQKECADVDECSENLHDCDLHRFTCINTQGGFRCQTRGCPAGLRLNQRAQSCEDIDECYENTHNCSLSTSECINTYGGFHCQPIIVADCLNGYRYNPAAQSCEDINECIENLHNCNLHTHSCVNTEGRFRCQLLECPAGFRPNVHSRSCEDINECISGTHNCSSPELCVNTIGGFLCKSTETLPCADGHSYNEDTEQCQDINECQEGTHTCDSEKEVCINNIGGFVCRTLICPSGYRPNILARTCIDVNECEEQVHNCSSNQECINRIGGFYCQTVIIRDCPLGYKYDLPSKSCKDIDECEENLHNCPSSHYCVNIPGNFVCHAICQQGFINDPNDPRQCKDIDECVEGTDSCVKNTEICINSIGSYRCVSHHPDCTAGYHYDPSVRICVDVDECAENRHNCLPNQICLNIPGNFQCVSDSTVQECSAGFRYNSATGQCTDVDECEENLHSCDANEECSNTDGNYKCIPSGRKLSPPCTPGYHYNPRSDSCVDIDECYERLHNCNLKIQNCVNTEGSFVCKNKRKLSRNGNGRRNGQSKHKCSPGYRLDKSNNLCVDINECQTGQHACTVSQRCDNTIGSYTCVRTTSCGTGYTLNAQTGQCEDDDECELGLHDCGLLHSCHNMLGSFRCVLKVCPSGYRLDANGLCVPIVCNEGFEVDNTGNCVDINECTQSNICPPNHQCVNSIGSYKCEKKNLCGEGFQLEPSSSRCIDIDECARGTHACRSGQTCVNRQGGYACQCPLGYTMNTRRECEDVDECTRYGNICTENGHCVNTPGSYVCRCKTGFKQSGDGKTCIDVDECEQAFVCHQKCINTWGSYQCSCNQGYSLSDDSRTCQDIDECTLWRGRGQLCIGICVNEPGSYSCNCPDGYKLGADKRTCHDINECSQPNSCRQENEVCLNTRGGYRCNAIVCPANYIRDTDHKTRCNRESLICQQGESDCLRAPLSISYNYITFVSNLRIPQSGHIVLFTFRGLLLSSSTVQFTLEMTNARAPVGVVPATRAHFDLQRTSFNQAVVMLVKSIEGPQDIELELIMKVYSNTLYAGQAVAKIFIVVSQYEF